MSWALRAHIRNLVMRASIGSSFSSVEEMQRGTSAKCTTDLSPYPLFEERKHFPPPTDSPTFVKDRIAGAYALVEPHISLSKHHSAVLQRLVCSPSSEGLFCDLFWYVYLELFGRKFAAASGAREVKERDTFRQVMKNVFEENDIDNSGTVDSSELSHLLQQMNIELKPEYCAELIAVVDENGDNSLSLDGFLEMMCIHIISDISLRTVESELKKVRHRASKVYMEKVMFPFRLSLKERDAVTAPYCKVLSSAVVNSFIACYTEKRGEFSGTFSRNVEELIMIWLTGMAMSKRSEQPVRPSTARPTVPVPRPPQSLQATPKGDGSPTLGKYLFGKQRDTRTWSAFDCEELEDLCSSLRSTKVSRRVSLQAADHNRVTDDSIPRDRTRSKSHREYVPPQTPRQQTAVLDMNGLSEPFTCLFSPTHHRRHTLSTVKVRHDDSRTAKNTFGEMAARCRSLSSPRNEISRSPRAPKTIAPTSQLTISKIARKMDNARLEEEKGKEKEVGTTFHVIYGCYCDVMGEMALSGPVRQMQDDEHGEVLEGTSFMVKITHLHDAFSSILESPLFRYLPKHDRAAAIDASTRLGKLIAQKRRGQKFASVHKIREVDLRPSDLL